jgi:hypothetical protein
MGTDMSFNATMVAYCMQLDPFVKWELFIAAIALACLISSSSKDFATNNKLVGEGMMPAHNFPPTKLSGGNLQHPEFKFLVCMCKPFFIFLSRSSQ